MKLVDIGSHPFVDVATIIAPLCPLEQLYLYGKELAKTTLKFNLVDMEFNSQHPFSCALKLLPSITDLEQDIFLLILGNEDKLPRGSPFPPASN